MSGTYTVSDEAALNAAIIAIDAASLTASGAAYVIDITAGFTMSTDLAAISLANGDSLQIAGPTGAKNAKLTGAGHRGFTVLAGNVSIDALNLAGFKAKGGNGGGGKSAGGGGAGLGGALFVGTGAAVTLANVGFASNTAAGGHGGGKTATGIGAGGAGKPGGFGAGGAGGVTPGFGGGGGAGAPGGFGGGANAGGGLAAGSNIFVQAGGQLNFTAGTTVAGTLTSGAGGAKVFGDNIFIQGNTSITLGNVTVAGVITDQTGSGGTGPNAGAGALLVDGATSLTGADSYTGGTIIEAGGALTLGKTGAAGSGEITFGAGANGALIVAAKATFGNVIGGFVTGDTIDLQGIGTATGTSLSNGNILSVTGGSATVNLALDPAQSYANYAFVVQPDGAGTGSVVSVITQHFDISSEAGFNAAMAAIDKGGVYAQPNIQYSITLTAGFTLNTDLDAVNLTAGSSLTINGNGQTIDGGGKYRGLFVYGGMVAVNALTIADAVAAGGAGGSGAAPGGGGAGLGGGLFVAAGTAVTLNNVSFLNDSAIGGAGGAIIAGTAAGGGGGLGGAGGAGTSHAGGGGGVGAGAVGGSYGGATAGQGILLGGGAGMAGQGTNGGGASGADGGGGGWAGIFSGSGRDPRSTPGPSGAGGDTGNGAFGGGGGNAGGSSAYPGYAAGFGGGAAGSGSAAGYGGGGPGGGGNGAGGDVFVQAGGSLIITGAGAASGGAVAGGVSTIGTNGAAYGSGIYFQGANTLTLAPAAGQSLTESDVIADEAGATGSGGVVAVAMTGAGILALDAANQFTGGLSINAGQVALNAPGAAGTGTITFGYGANATLTVAAGDVPANTIAFFIPGDVIDLQGIGTATSAILGPNDVLAVTGGATPVNLTFSAAQNFTNESFAVATDGHGGTLLTAVDKNGDLPAGIAGAAIAGNDHAAFDPFRNVTISTLIPGQVETATLILSTTADGTVSNVGTGSYNALTGLYTATGTAAQLTADIANLVFTPTEYQAAPGAVVNTGATLSVTDGTMTAAAPFNIAVTALNDAPVITGGAGAQDGYWNVPIAPFTGITISDPDHAAFETVTLSIGNAYGNAVPAGSFALASPVDGVSLTEVNGNTYTLAGAPAAVTAALQATSFTPAVTAPQLGFAIDSIGISVSDGIAAPVITSDTVYAGLPIITGLAPTLSVKSGATIAPFSAAVVTDSAYFTTGSITITLEPNGGGAGPGTDANGTLTGTGLTKAGVGTYTIANAAFATITAELDSIIFHPSAVAAGQTVTTGFVIDVFDGATTSGWFNNVVTLGKGAVAPAAKMAFAGGSASVESPFVLTHGFTTPAPIKVSSWMGGGVIHQAAPSVALGALPEAPHVLAAFMPAHHFRE